MPRVLGAAASCGCGGDDGDRIRDCWLLDREPGAELTVVFRGDLGVFGFSLFEGTATKEAPAPAAVIILGYRLSTACC